MSLYLVMMKDEHNRMLSWPFKVKVTFKLISICGEDQISEISPEFSERPTEENEVKAGHSQFIPQNFVRDDYDHGQYILDNSIYIKCEVSCIA